MSRFDGYPGIFCASEEYEYQMLADEKHLYIVRLGKNGAPDMSRALRDLSEYAAGWGNTRIAKAGLESVRCMSDRGRTVIVITRGENAYRFETTGETEQVLMTEVFRGAPLRMTTGKRHRATAHSDRMEIGMFVACFALVALSMGWEMLHPATSGLLWSLGWMIIPLVWMVYCARRPGVGKDQTGFSLGVGAMATIFSCVFLWLTPNGRPDSWLQLLVPALVIAGGTVVIYAVAKRGFRLVSLFVVAIIALVAYAPGAARCLNELLPARQVVERDAVVVELVNQYDRGDWNYYLIIEDEGAQMAHQISREEYVAMEGVEFVRVIRTTGALGVDYTDIRMIEDEVA